MGGGVGGGCKGKRKSLVSAVEQRGEAFFY